MKRSDWGLMLLLPEEAEEEKAWFEWLVDEEEEKNASKSLRSET